MEKNEKLSIEVAYATAEQQVIATLQVEVGCTLEKAIERSGIPLQFPEIDLKKQPVGIFSQPKALDAEVQDGDRIEIYRELLADPKEIRRLKAVRAKSQNRRDQQR